MGCQKSAKKCKEKFEEESRNFSTNYSSRFFVSDLDEQVLYNHNDNENNPQVSSSPAAAQKAQDNINNNNLGAKEKNDYEEEEEGGNNVAVGINEEKMILMCRKRRKKRKRAEEKEEEEFEMFKGFCESIVRKIMGQQEELHKKLIEDMIRRDEESMAREEAWRIQEIDRINKEMEKRWKEQAISGDRQAKIIDFLNKFTVTSSELIPPPPAHQQEEQEEVDQNNIALIKNKFQDLLHKLTNPSNNNNPTSSSSTDQMSHGSRNPNEVRMADEKGGERDTSTGKRWPRDEVLALINLRCSLNNNNNIGGDGSTTTAKGNNNNNNNNGGCPNVPLWERISQMMLELGYERSAKRCKEKWENINKYFRKTKDNKKKRSMDSRTCPYFHQLSNLYSQAAGTSSLLLGPSNNHS